MKAVMLMLAVTACYTITSLSDKYAVSKAKFSGDAFTFLMCASMSVFIGLTLPFQTLYVTASWQSLAAVLLIAGCKLLEFQMSALVLRQLSAFELKAWLGVTLFISYLTDACYGAELRVMKLVCISAVVFGLVLIAKFGKAHQIEYRTIILPLILYLTAKFGYGLIIRSFTPYISAAMQLFPALVIVALIMLPRAKPKDIFRQNPQGARKIILARIPNAAGMLMENQVIAVSLVNYSLIQPMILVVLFLIALLRKEQYSKLNFIGSMICVIGIVIFQLI